MAETQFYDLVVVGAGPAGTTLATLVKKYNPEARVLILERETFPRHHIGESLLPGMIPVLKEMGVFDKLNAGGFPRKMGAVFVWGKDRTPWDADFNNLNVEMVRRHGRALDAEFSWQVERSKYDQVLLEHARSLGVECWEATKALAPEEEEGRIVGLTAEGLFGRRRLRCGVLADCSGQQGFLAKHRGTRRYREDLKNVAAYAYYRGAPWKFEYAGHPDKTKIFVCSVPEGWFWYIPLAKDLVSVGLVAKASYVKERGLPLPELFERAVAACPEIGPLLKDARREKGKDPSDPEKDFFTASDWSYVNERACGPGWVAAGDAAFFLDPLLSSGVMMAHLSGHRAAYAINTALREKDPEVLDLLWKDYDRFCKEVTGSFLALIGYWYKHEPNAAAWWGEAKKALDASSPLDLDDKMSFVAVAAGLTYYFERAYTMQSLVFGSAGVEHTWQWEGTKQELRRWTRQILAIVETGFLKFAPADEAAARAKSMTALEKLEESWVPRWDKPRRREITFLPSSQGGTLRPIHRVAAAVEETPDAVAEAARPKRMLPRSYMAILDLVDGARSVGEIKDALRASSVLPADVIEGQVFRILKDMAVLGALSFGRTSPSHRAVPEGPAGWKAFREGEALLKAGSVERAESLLDEAVTAGLPGALPLALRGEARRHLGRAAEGLADLDAAMAAASAAPAPAPAASRLDVLLAELGAEVERAWVEDRVRILRAKARLAAGDARGAREDAEGALALNPRQSEALVVRAKAALEGGEFGPALSDLKDALAIENSGKKGEG